MRHLPICLPTVARLMFLVGGFAELRADEELLLIHQGDLPIDIHGQRTSAETAYRGTSNGLTVTGLRQRSGETAHTGPESLLGILKRHHWTVDPDPFDGKEQSGFTGGHIVRTYGSHRADGIDAMQLELGSNYRKPSERKRVAAELADSIVEFAVNFLELKTAAHSARESAGDVSR